MYTNVKKEQKNAKKGLPNEPGCGIILEHQVRRQRMTSEEPLRSEDERTNMGTELRAEAERGPGTQVQKKQRASKIKLDKNQICGIINELSAERLRVHRTLKIEQYRKTCNGTFSVFGKTQ